MNFSEEQNAFRDSIRRVLLGTTPAECEPGLPAHCKHARLWKFAVRFYRRADPPRGLRRLDLRTGGSSSVDQIQLKFIATVAPFP